MKSLNKIFEGIRYLLAGTMIRVLEFVGHKETRPYYPRPHYRVLLPEQSGVRGWILSIALSPDGVNFCRGLTRLRRDSRSGGSRHYGNIESDPISLDTELA